MKTSKIIIALLILNLAFSTSCSKNDDVETEGLPEYPMKSLIESGLLELNYEKTSPNTFEMGYKFKTFKSGKITALGIRVPDNDTYRVTLWNVDSVEILKTVNIVSSSGLLSFQDIDAIHVQSGVSYFVSISTNDYYSFNGQGNKVFPAEVNSVLITGYGSYLGSNQALPNQFSQYGYLGMVDIKFAPNN